MYFYNAYGLVIQSVIPLPELVATEETKADVAIQLGKIERSPLEIDMGRYRFYMNDEEVYFAWENVGTFLVRGSTEIIVEAAPGVKENFIHFPLLGMALAVVLHKRSLLVIHASSVAIDGSAIAFLGTGGMGKSTMAATLYGRGHTLISDDLLALDVGDANHPMVIPSFPQFKLWPEAVAAALGEDPQTLPCLASEYEKRVRRATDNFSLKPLPLKAIYILSPGTTKAIKPIPPHECIFYIIANSHIARIAKPLVEGLGASSHFRLIINLIKNAPVYRLERPFSLSLLPDVARLVEENFHKNTHLTMV
jgi:hypothetical protein